MALDAETYGQRPVRTPEWLASWVTRIERNPALDPAVDQVRRAGTPVSDGRAADILRGRWLGHALHPVLTDFPLGCFISAGLLDLLGGRKARPAAQRLIGLGLLAVPPTVASGLADFPAVRTEGGRRVAAVHAIGNGAAAGLYFLSWRARRRNRHARGVLLAMLGGTGAWVTGYLGGHLSFGLGTGVGPRGLGEERSGSDGPLVDVATASTMLGVPVDQVHAMVEEGLLVPAEGDTSAPRFRDTDVLAVRLLGG
jgi:uncharacterized membrane protein